MTVATHIARTSRSISLPKWMLDLGIACALCIAVYATYLAMGLPTLFDAAGDSDSLLRLVEIRDLLGGQGWFDLHQYRMGADGGFVMHWSRLIDAPIAALILLASMLGFATPLAENIALTLWPLILMIGTMFGLLQLARSLGNEHTIFPAAALALGAIYFVGIYRPGSIDHHNAQIGLTVAMLAFLVNAPGRPRFPAYAGLCAALMLAIGMETAPYVAAGCAGVSLAFLFGDEAEARRAATFALAFAAATFTAFLATVDPSNWSAPACDALSNFQLSLAAIGGLGLALIALAPALNATFTRRLASLAALAIIAGSVVRYGFPQCLADPYAAVDARLRDLWLNNITEVQSVFALARHNWPKLLTYFVTPLLALAFLAALVRRDGATRARLFYGGFLFATFLVSCWQVRGSSFSIPLATVALAIGVGMLRERLAKSPSNLGSVGLVAAWLVSVNLVWSAMAGRLESSPQADAGASAEAATTANCWASESFTSMAGMPEGTVLAVSDLGSPMLAYTPHRVLAGSYHRNIEGNRAMVEAMMATPDQARAIAGKYGVDYVVLCRGNVESSNYAALAPHGFMAALMQRRIPDWLTPVAGTDGGPLEIYRVERAAKGQA
ncbi:MAG: GtrA family protein [Rhizobiaceae bacterium]|nr:GtrA family protein [Rhizobiaceae bacterium]